jgi:hypothetical protein
LRAEGISASLQQLLPAFLRPRHSVSRIADSSGPTSVRSQCSRRDLPSAHVPTSPIRLLPGRMRHRGELRERPESCNHLSGAGPDHGGTRAKRQPVLRCRHRKTARTARCLRRLFRVRTAGFRSDRQRPAPLRPLRPPGTALWVPRRRLSSPIHRSIQIGAHESCRVVSHGGTIHVMYCPHIRLPTPAASILAASQRIIAHRKALRQLLLNVCSL